MRFWIVGTSGSGKSTIAKMAAERLRIPHIELDALRHGPNWVETPDDEFRKKVAALIEQDSWIVDGNYGVVRDLVGVPTTTIVWLDLPKAVVMAQVIWRSMSRAITGRELWNGNRERFWTWLSPSHPIRWAWSTHAGRRREYSSMMKENWLRLRNRREINDWLNTLRPINHD